MAKTIKAAEADLHLGRRLRAWRMERRVSLQALAASLGCSYQQVQKYERGANRISAATLARIAVVLKTPVAEFYRGLPGLEAWDDGVLDRLRARLDAVVGTPGGAALLDAFVALPPRLRHPVVALARAALEEG